MGFKFAQQLFGRTEALFDLDRLTGGSRAANEAAIRSLAANAYLGGDTSLCRVLGRYKMFVDAQDDGLSSHLLLDGFWEMWITEVMARRVRRGMTAVDVGANLGYFTLVMADLVGPQGRVHAFEPNPPIARRLRRSVVVNGFEGRVRVYPVALSNRDGDAVRLVVPQNEPKNAYIVACSPRGAGAEADPMVLTTRRLDSFPDLAAADFFKIDADNAEEAIWRGMNGIFETQRSLTIVLEFAPARYADPLHFLNAIAAQGFATRLIDRAKGERDATPAQILSGPPLEDRMLLLCR